MAHDIKLSQEERELINNIKIVREYGRIAKNVKKNKFSVGDFINCYNIVKNRYVPMSVHYPNVAAIYRVVYVNDNGLVFTKKICMDGMLSKVIECISIAGSELRYTLDKCYADFLILSDEGEEFNPQHLIDDLKSHRQEIQHINKMSRLRTTSIKPIIKWMSQLQPGDNLWFQPLYGQQPSDAEYTIKKVKSPNSRNVEIVIESNKGYGRVKTLDAMSLIGVNVWNIQPSDYEE